MGERLKEPEPALASVKSTSKSFDLQPYGKPSTPY
jgi:hypothetical protein